MQNWIATVYFIHSSVLAESIGENILTFVQIMLGAITINNGERVVIQHIKNKYEATSSNSTLFFNQAHV